MDNRTNQKDQILDGSREEKENTEVANSEAVEEDIVQAANRSNGKNFVSDGRDDLVGKV